MCVREGEEAPHYILSLSPPLFPHHYNTPKMSINHFSPDLPEAHWWSHYSSPAKTSSPIPNHTSSARFCLSPHLSAAAAANPMFSSQTSTVSFDLNNDDDDEVVAAAADENSRIQSETEIPKERLFEKPLTPSDVGKLNRLVIPKQHAEKHFPLNGCGDAGENGLLLGFEDEIGKSWRFRYSYWNSSQSYVLTKGWSRFVKEKRLDAGDIVVFARHRVDSGRLFIGWRRRNSGGGNDSQPAANGGGSGAWSRMYYSGHPYQIQQQAQSNSLPYQPESLHAGVQNQTTSSGSKRLRLFGVNLECQADESEPSTPVGSPMSSHQHPYYSSNHHMQQDISFSGGADVYRQG